MQSVRQNSARALYQMINVLEKRCAFFSAQNARPRCISRKLAFLQKRKNPTDV